MDSGDPALEHLSTDESVRLTGSVPAGPISYSRQAPPAGELVIFTSVDGDIVIRTDVRCHR